MTTLSGYVRVQNVEAGARPFCACTATMAGTGVFEHMMRALALYTDVELLAMCATRTASALDALSELYERHHQLAIALARRINPDPTNADDLVEAAFLTIWERAERYDPAHPNHLSVETWLLGLVRYHAHMPTAHPLLLYPGLHLDARTFEERSSLAASV